MRKYKAAIADRNIQVEAHRGLSEVTGKELTSAWEDMCNTWEQTPYPKYKAAANPYEIKNAGGPFLSEKRSRWSDHGG